MGSKVEPPTCIVCSTTDGRKRHLTTRMSRVTVEARTLVLCRDHAAQVATQRPKTWQELRAIFASGPERRSPVPRRNEADDRRVLPPRPEGRRLAFGRRQEDPQD